MGRFLFRFQLLAALVCFFNLPLSCAPVYAIEKASDKKPLVFVTPAKKSDFFDTVQYPARVRSTVNAWVNAEAPGQVQKILKPVGSKVRRGEAVLVIKNIDPVYNYAAVKILSPADGFVTNLDVDLFARVDHGDKLFSVTDPSRLLIETEIPASELHFFKIGDTGTLRMQNAKEIHVVIYSLSPAVDLKTGTAGALLRVDTPSDQLDGQSLTQGALGQLDFHVNQRRSFVLPESALVSRNGNTFVRVLNGTQAKLVPVKVSLDLGDKIEIQNGLQDGERVITRWNRFIGDNEEVEVEHQDDPGKAQL